MIYIGILIAGIAVRFNRYVSGSNATGTRTGRIRVHITQESNARGEGYEHDLYDAIHTAMFGL